MALDELIYLVLALFLEGVVAYAQRLVYYQDIRIHVDVDGKAQPDPHS